MKQTTQPSSEMIQRVSEHLNNIHKVNRWEGPQLIKAHWLWFLTIAMAGADDEQDFRKGVALFVTDLLDLADQMIEANPNRWSKL